MAELRVIKEQLKEKQEVLEAEMEASRREKKTQAEEVTFFSEMFNSVRHKNTVFWAPWQEIWRHLQNSPH